MDCAFNLDGGSFVFRVGGVFVHDGYLLAIRWNSGSFYLPGGKAQLYETMEETLQREIFEELGLETRVTRMLWFCERTYIHNENPIHEISTYFQAELDWDRLPSFPNDFSHLDSDGFLQHFEWLSIDKLNSVKLFPSFLKRQFPNIPKNLLFDTEMSFSSKKNLPDCKFLTENGLFNYRVAGVFVHDGRLLAMRESNLTHYYLPGGRVRLHESLSEALRREIREELYCQAKVIRPLWLCESFFSLNINTPVHELAVYFLAELDWDGLPTVQNEFTLDDSDGDEHIFSWLDADQVRSSSIYPFALKECFPALPQHLTFVSNVRDRLVL